MEFTLLSQNGIELIHSTGVINGYIVRQDTISQGYPFNDWEKAKQHYNRLVSENQPKVEKQNNDMRQHILNTIGHFD